MKLGVYSHCSIDTIRIGQSSYTQAGGAACYCGITARRFKFDVDLFTRFGGDFEQGHLADSGICPVNAASEAPTTRFELEIRGSERDIYLKNACDAIAFSHSDADGILVSPLFDEITPETYGQIKDDAGFLFVDPQGFVRRTDNDGRVFLEGTDVDLSGVSAVKASAEEARCLVGCAGPEAMGLLAKKGAKHVLYTEGREISMLDDDRVYSLTLPDREVRDTTGIGDIFSSAFACVMLKERDSLWAFCFAGGAAQAALESKKVGLEKIPPRGAVESNASYYYNTVKFAHV